MVPAECLAQQAETSHVEFVGLCVTEGYGVLQEARVAETLDQVAAGGIQILFFINS